MTTANTGSYAVEDLLQIKNRSVSDFGIAAIAKTFADDLAYYNAAVQDQLGLLAESTTEHTLAVGTSHKQTMQEVDDMGKAKTGKVVPGQTLGVPLKLFKSALGWTSKYAELASVREMALGYEGIKTGYADAIQTELKKAIFNNVNYSFVDSLDSGVTLSVKRFANNDGTKYADSGTRSFATTHNHYLARVSTLASSDVDGLISTVAEHQPRGMKIFINYADRSTFEALTGFKALASANMIYNASDATIIRANVEDDLENKLIGFYGDVEVWTKPFIPSEYWVCAATNADTKPLAFRQRKQTALQGLRFINPMPDYPLIVDNAEAEFGFAALNRTALACLYIGGTSWSNPTL